MALSTGTVTVMSGSGSIYSVSLTTDSAGFALASSFPTMAATIASSADTVAGSGYFVALNGVGEVEPIGYSQVLVGDSSTLFYADTVSGAGIVSGDGNDTIVAGGSNDTIDAGAGSNQIILTGSADTVTTAGNDTITSLSSALNLTDDGASAVVYLYGGNLTVAGSGINDVYANSSTITLTDSGSDVLVFNQPSAAGSSVYVDASNATGDDQFWAGSGNVTLVGGSGNDLFAAGAGSATATGGTGSNVFALFEEDATASTSLTVDNFTSSDMLALVDFGSGTTYTITETNGSDVFTLSSGATITLVGYTGLTDSSVETNNGLPVNTTKTV